MPTGPLSAAPTVIESVLALDPLKIVDLGMGTGKYGFLLREQRDFSANRLERADWTMSIVGVEGWAEYVQAHQRSVYTDIVVDDVRAWLQSQADVSFDVALALDIVEHFRPRDAAHMIGEALRVARHVVITTPRAFFKQSDHENPLEQHLSWWPEAALRKVAKYHSTQIVVSHDPLNVVAMLGVAPRLITGGSFKRTVRTHLIPDGVYWRLRGRTGPRI